VSNLLSQYPTTPGFLFPYGGAPASSGSTTTTTSGGAPTAVVIPGIVVPEPFSAGIFLAGLAGMLALASYRARASR
jgi:hypothetical protein